MWPISFAKKYSTPFLILALVASLAFIAYLKYVPKDDSNRTEPGPVQYVPVIKTVEKIKTVSVPGPERVVFIPKSELVGSLKMPELEKTPDNVLSVGRVNPSDGPTTVVSTLSPTGEGHILIRQEPPKFFQLKKEFRAEARYLFAGRNLVELDLVANPVRVGPVNILAGAGVEVRRDDSSFGARAFVGFQYKF